MKRIIAAVLCICQLAVMLCICSCSSGKNNLLNLSSKEFVSRIKIGINTGRSLDCQYTKSGDVYTVEDLNATEQKYDFIQPTDTELIKAFKSAGYNAVRMPVNWSQAIGDGPDYKISDILMDRVVEVIDLILEQDMYCILSICDDSSWIYARNPDLDEMFAKYTAVWKQIAERFKDYDGRLMFEGYNEVLKLTLDWSGDREDSDFENINKLAQKFVDAVRSTGSNNKNRFLIIAPYGAWLGETELSKLKLPTDSAKHKILVNVYFYFPQGALPDGGLVDADTAKADIDEKFEIIKSNLTDKGYTVIIDEFGIADHNPVEVRADCAEYIAKKATELDIPLFWWDNGYTFGVFDRSAAPYEQKYPEIISAMMKGVEGRG
ncbi:MAG: glycoside hydrolase family 5 protein [Acutalibacteraceae bacterium]